MQLTLLTNCTSNLNIGIFLQAYNAKYNKNYTAREFFDEVFYPLVFDANKYLQWVQNSPFVQMKAKQKVETLTSQERIEKLDEFHQKIAAGNQDASVALGYAASEEKGFATTSGQVTNMKIMVTQEDVYLSWIGSGLGLGVKGGISILFDNPDLLLDIFEGWKYYRKKVDENILLKGNQLTSAWNAQWLTHRYSKVFNPNNPFANFFPDEEKNGIWGIEPQSWTHLLIGICRHYEQPKLMGYVYGFGQMNTTIGFIPFVLSQIRYMFELYERLFQMRSDDAEKLWGTAFGLQKACQSGVIGIRAMEPKGLEDYISAKKSPKYKKDDINQTILFNTYITWIIAMLNNEELWAKALKFATVLQNFSMGNKQGKTLNSRKVDEVIKATNKMSFINSLVDIVSRCADSEAISEIASVVNTMPTENVPYFLTLVRFQYAKINNNQNK